MNIGWPQIIYFALVMTRLGVEISRHGEMEKPRRRNAYTAAVAALIIFGLLWWGGFFR